MSQPATEPIVTDPANPATDPPADPAPVTDPPADPAGESEDARVKRANAQAAASRVALREQEAKVAELEATLGKLAAVFNPDSGATDPAEQLANITSEAESLRTEVSQLRAELTVHSLAADNGGNALALLDSRSFTDALHRLDSDAADFTDQVANAIKDAVTKNATLAASGQGPSRGGAPGVGQGPAEPGGVTQEQFDAMGLAQRNELYRTNPDLYRTLAANIR